MGTVKRLFNALGNQISDSISRHTGEADDDYITLYDYEEQKYEIYELIKMSINKNDPEIARGVIHKYISVAKSDPVFMGLVNQWTNDILTISQNSPARPEQSSDAASNIVPNRIQPSQNVFKVIALKERFEQNKGRILNMLYDSFNNNDFNKVANIIEKYYSVAKSDADFFEVIKYIEHELKSKNIMQLENSLSNTPDNDLESRMTIIRNILKIDQDSEKYRSELIKCEKTLNINEYDAKQEEQVESETGIFSRLPSTMKFKKNSLIEITDKNFITRIIDLIPKTSKAGNNNVNLPPVINAAPSGQSQLFMKITPDPLAQVKGKSGVYRGFSRNAKGISSQAEFVPVTPNAVSAAGGLALTNVAMLSMAVSMVAIVAVGAYFMNKLSHKIDGLQFNLSQISDFLDSEFKSKILALCAQVSRMRGFIIEIMENDELRKNELFNLDNYQNECIQLLGQANVQLEKIADKPFGEFDEYESNVNNIEKWQQYQLSLLCILSVISQLNYVFHQGALSYEHSKTLYVQYNTHSQKVNNKLIAYHTKAIEFFEIDLDMARRANKGILNKPLSLLNNSYTFKDISSQTISNINNQVSRAALPIDFDDNTGDLFNEDVRIVINDGHFYYYPKEHKTSENYNYPALIGIIRNTDPASMGVGYNSSYSSSGDGSYSSSGASV